MTAKMTESNGGGVLRRTILLLAVAALMAAMMVVTVASPAFAGPSRETCAKIGLKHGKLPPSCPVPSPVP